MFIRLINVQTGIDANIKRKNMMQSEGNELKEEIMSFQSFVSSMRKFTTRIVNYQQ